MIHACHNKQGHKSHHNIWTVSTQAPMHQHIENKPKEPSLWCAFVMPKMCETSISNCVPRLSESRSRWSRTTSRENRCTSGESAHLSSAAAGEDGDYLRNQRPHQLTHMAECVNYICRNTPPHVECIRDGNIFSPPKSENKKEVKGCYFQKSHTILLII